MLSTTISAADVDRAGGAPDDQRRPEDGGNAERDTPSLVPVLNRRPHVPASRRSDELLQVHRTVRLHGHHSRIEIDGHGNDAVELRRPPP